MKRQGISPDFFFRGVSFTHEGWSGNGGGYASDEAAAQLRDIHDLGANAIALVPYAYAPRATIKSITPIQRKPTKISARRCGLRTRSA